MYSNHGNIYLTLLAMVLGRYGVPHVAVNVTEYGGEGRTGTGMETGTEKDSRSGKNGSGNIGREGGRRERGGQRSTDTKMHPLVEDVLEYRKFYEGEGAD